MYVHLHTSSMLMIMFDIETSSEYVNRFCCCDKDQNMKKTEFILNLATPGALYKLNYNL